MTPTEQQRRAIESEERNKFIDAVPGSGKTYVAVERMARLIGKGINPEKSVLISFTVSASSELQRRLEIRLGKKVQFYVCGTIHSFCARVLRDAGRTVSVLSESEFDEIVGLIWLERSKRGKPSRKAVDEILKDGPQRFTYLPSKMSDAETIALAVWRKLSNESLMSFDALLYAALRHLQANPVMLDCLCVDEIQDSSREDFQLFEQIRAEWKTFVGDRNQSIFGFRKACPEMLEKLTK